LLVLQYGPRLAGHALTHTHTDLQLQQLRDAGGRARLAVHLLAQQVCDRLPVPLAQQRVAQVAHGPQQLLRQPVTQDGRQQQHVWREMPSRKRACTARGWTRAISSDGGRMPTRTCQWLTWPRSLVTRALGGSPRSRRCTCWLTASTCMCMHVQPAGPHT
jgi:hypothetical protein